MVLYRAKIDSRHGDQGWRRLQEQMRGTRDIDVVEWRDATKHKYGDSRHARDAADIFWELVSMKSRQEKEKLLFYWCVRWRSVSLM